MARIKRRDDPSIEFNPTEESTMTSSNIEALSACNSMRSPHDTAKGLVAKKQLDLAFEPKRADASKSR